MKNPAKIAEVLRDVRPAEPTKNQATDWSTDEVVRAKRELDRIIRHGNNPDRPEAWGSYPAICPDWEWEKDYAPQYNAVLNWMLGIPCECQGHPIAPGRGLWLVGNTGTGKSTLMKAVKHFCAIFSDPRSANMPRSMAWRHAKDIVADYEQYGAKALDDLCEMPALIIDDLGTEDREATRYGSVKNVVEEILSRRYDRKLMTLVTTNLDWNQVKAFYHTRIYDRIRESFNIIQFAGKSHRKQFNPDM